MLTLPEEPGNRPRSIPFPTNNNASPFNYVDLLQPQPSPAEPLPGALHSLKQTMTASPASFDKDPLLQTKSDTQSMKPSSSNYSLWDKALTQLRQSKEDPDIVAVVNKFSADGNIGDGPGIAKGLAKDIKEEMEREIKNQQDSHTYRFVEKTVSMLTRFIMAGDVAVNFDPVHAALPWAVVRFVLLVSICSIINV